MAEQNTLQAREIDILRIQLSRSHNKTPMRQPSIFTPKIRDMSEISEPPSSYDSKSIPSSAGRFPRQDSAVRRGEAREIAEARRAEQMTLEESFSEFEHAIASTAADGLKFSSRFQEFLEKYKGLKDEALEQKD